MKTANSKSVKISNSNLVVEKLVELKETSRVDLSRETTLNKATVSSIIQELIDKNIVIELSKKIKTNGRSANAIALNKNAGRILSLDLQTHLIYGVISNLYGEILFEINRPIEVTDFSPYLTVLLETIDELKSNTFDSIYGIIGIGIGVYGILSKSKKVVYAPFSSWKDIELNKIVEDYTGIKTYVENEANISALGENIAHANQENLISLNIGIGVGMGVIIDNKLYTGENGYAGEIGHTILIPNGRECVCGNHGCLEKYISEIAICESYYSLTKEKVTIDEYISRLKKKDEAAIKIYRNFIDYVSITINNISQTFNPQTIVINSKIIENMPESISLIKNKLRSKIMELEVLTTSTYKRKTNVLGLTHVLIQKFLNIENYTVKS
jgi:predicted NBD/HSP70 family sugar kinase